MDNISEKRLADFEKMLSSVREQYAECISKMAALKAEEKEKTVTFRQLMATKMQLWNMLSLYKIYGLTD